MKRYLCYNIRAIQSYIFQVPLLKFIIGGSAIIDKFDRETIPAIKVRDTEHVYSAGGKGAFICSSETGVDAVQRELVKNAHALGLDIRFGLSTDFSEASHNTDKLFSYSPLSMEGEPCQVSGLYPVSNTNKAKNIHDIVAKRLSVLRYFEEKYISDSVFLSEHSAQKKFFHNVSATEGQDGLDGARALGARNRWAVICMDGNDMGMQFREFSSRNPTPEDMFAWVKTMSRCLDTCTTEAVKAGIQRVVSEWNDPSSGEYTDTNGTLPIRPILVGGDDIVMLCHVRYAIVFVKEVMRVFEKCSADFHNEKIKSGLTLWPATNGRLTISAGILYCPISLPLHTAIPYTESLLASAKHRGRSHKKGKEVSPSAASLDWEQITDAAIDTPAAKRQREFRFFDEEIEEIVELTQRPYTLYEYTLLEEVSKRYRQIPPTIRYRILPALQQNYSTRLAFSAQVKKNYAQKLYSDLCEYPNTSGSRWTTRIDRENRKVRSIDVVDALLLLEEDERMKKETI
jgi:hypothetical protein